MARLMALRTLGVISLVSLLLITGSATNPLAPTSAFQQSSLSAPTSAGKHVPGEVVVQFRPITSVLPQASSYPTAATSSKSVNGLLQRIQATEIKSVFYEEHPPLFKQAPAAGSASKDPLLGQVYVIRFNPSIDVAQVVSQLKADPAVEDASPSGYSYLSWAPPNDPGYSQQWGPRKISLEPVWEHLTTGAEGILVAVIDSGIDRGHPDLAGQFVDYGRDYVHSNWEPDDELGHGTHVSGILGAVANNRLGIAGVYWHTVILPMKVFGADETARNLDVAAAIRDSADSAAQIINLSLGSDSDDLSIRSAIQYAVETKRKLVVAAAGNCADPQTFQPNGCSNVNPPYYYPAAYPHVLAVAATDENDGHPSFSNHGSFVDISAPGVDIYSTMPTYHVTLNDSPDGYAQNYDRLSGTSMATPFVSSVAAFMLAANPSLASAPNTIADLLRQSSDDVGPKGWDEFYGVGRVNAYKAVTAALGKSSDILAPGGTWISPTVGQTLNTSVHFAAHAYDNSGGRGVNYVNFTAWWHGSRTTLLPQDRHRTS